MNITINLEVGYEDTDDLLSWLDAGVNGVPVKKKRKRKPMTDKDKETFRERMVKGRNDAVKAREKKEAEVRDKPSTKKPVTNPRESRKKKASSG